VPSPGDILSFAGSTNHPVYGHTAVVTAVSVDANGNGTVTYMQQNASSNGWGSVTVSGKTLGDSISGWLHQPSTLNSNAHSMSGDFNGDGYSDRLQVTRLTSIAYTEVLEHHSSTIPPSSATYCPQMGGPGRR
jgi:hypothetical protein